MERAATSNKTCQICEEGEGRYTCSSCRLVYCSVPCYKRHKEESCSSDSTSQAAHTPLPTEPGTHSNDPESEERGLADPTPLRPLTSLNWPYIPDHSSYPDPLKRDDPKPLTLPQYENIASSPAIRHVLASNPTLKPLLTALDTLRGDNREQALQRMLNKTTSQSASSGLSGQYRGYRETFEGEQDLSEDHIRAFKELAEAVEEAVRGERVGKAGLDWEVVDECP